MKRTIILLAASILCLTGMTAQADDYVPMVREGVKWVYVTQPQRRYPTDYFPEREPYDYTTVTYELIGDTTINNVVFKKCWRTVDTPYDNYFYDDTPQVVAFLYEADKQVWAIFPTAFSNNMRGLMGYVPYTTEDRDDLNAKDRNLAYLIRRNNLRLLYDFNDVDTFLKNIPRKYYPKLDLTDPYFTVTESDVVETEGRKHVRYHLKAVRPSRTGSMDYEYRYHMATTFNEAYIVESYGFIPPYSDQYTVCESSSFLAPSGEFIRNDGAQYTPFFNTYFSHVEENGRIVFKGPLYNYAQFLLNGPTDAIEELKAEGEAGESRIYDLQGRVLNGEPATPGIYVKDGKKILVK